MFRHDARNTGYSPVTIKPPLRLAWRVQAITKPQRGTGPMLLATSGVVCVSEGQHEDTGLYDHSGSLRWRIPDAFPLYLKGGATRGRDHP